MKFCPTCASSCQDDIMFCPKCGTKLGTNMANQPFTGQSFIPNQAMVNMPVNTNMQATGNIQVPVNTQMPGTNQTSIPVHASAGSNVGSVTINNMNATNISGAGNNASVPVASQAGISPVGNDNPVSQALNQTQINNQAQVNNISMPQVPPMQPIQPTSQMMQQPQVAPAGKQKKSKAPKTPKDPNKKSKAPVIICLSLCGAIVIAAVLIIFLVLIPNGKKNNHVGNDIKNYKDLIPAYFELVNNRSTSFHDYLVLTCHPAIVDAYYAYSDVLMEIDKDTVYNYEDEYMQFNLYDEYDSFDAQYGSDWKIEVTDVTYKKLDDSELQEGDDWVLNIYYDIVDLDLESTDTINEKFESYKLTKKEISTLQDVATTLLDTLYDNLIEEAYEVEIECTVTGDGITDTETYNTNIAKVCGVWFIIDGPSEELFTDFIYEAED